MTKVMIVEDDPTFLNRFCQIVTADAELELFAAVRNGASARESLARGGPDVLLVDLGLPDVSGVEIIRETPGAIRHRHHGHHRVRGRKRAREHRRRRDGLSAEHAARGSSGSSTASRRGSPISPVIARQILKQLRPAGGAAEDDERQRAELSPREAEVLSFIAKGFSFGEIGKLLAISTHTVTAHVKNIYQKLAVHSRGEAVYEASRMGLLR
jgi:DNA-binding NarL/FixJ family response regulator